MLTSEIVSLVLLQRLLLEAVLQPMPCSHLQTKGCEWNAVKRSGTSKGG